MWSKQNICEQRNSNKNNTIVLGRGIYLVFEIVLICLGVMPWLLLWASKLIG